MSDLIIFPMEIMPGFERRSQLSSVQAVRTLFSYPYVNLIPQLFQQTREHTLALSFIEAVRSIISQNPGAFSFEESDEIDLNLTTLELSCLDYLNLWDEYIESFEHYFVEKRTPAFLVRFSQRERDPSQYGRYLVNIDTLCPVYAHFLQPNSFYVHDFFFLDDRLNIIKRKIASRNAGKNVEHLKRYTIEMFSAEELDSRYDRMYRLWRFICSRTSD